MNFSQICVFIGGVLTLCMGVFHTQFAKMFSWKEELSKISDGNQKIFLTIHIALFLLFFMIGTFSVIYFKALSSAQGMSQYILILISLFWLWRALWQILYFKPSKHRRFRKYLIMHIILTVWFLILFTVHAIPVVYSF